ncbi:MAG: hypothetical protein V4608_09110 [Bacteroidota bacterium]
MKKKVNINRPDISSEEISKGKNFDSVLKQHTAGSKPFFKKPWFLSGVVAVTIAVVTAVVLQTKNPENKSTDTVQQNNEMYANSTALTEFYKTEEAKPCINPPLEGLNIPVTTYKVIAEKGAALAFKTGSKIIIPKNVFVDENGKTLKGEVELRYREFHDAVDFFVAGIPMTYDSAGVRYHFESAGMMEMLAYQNGKAVNIASDKSINVELASNYTGNEYNLYKLDTIKNNWSCLGKDKVVTKPLESKSDASLSTQLNHINKVEETPEFKTIETKKEEVQKEKEVRIAALPKLLAEPQKPTQSKKDKYTFNLEVDSEEYPELAVYKGVLFEVGSENKTFSNEMYNVTWDEAIIKEGSRKGENYLLTLKKANKKFDLVVYPVFEGANYESAMKNFQEKFSKYTVALDKRKADESRIEEAYQSQLAMLKKQQEDLQRKWKEQQDNQFKLMDTQEKVYRMFAVNSFGVYNSDKPSLYPSGVSCTAKLNNANNAGLMCYGVFLVDREKNGLFSYNKNPVVKFSFNPQSTNLLWTVENGTLYWLKPEQFKEIKNTTELCNITMNKVDQKFKSVEEIKTFFNF